ncbi:MAG: alanine racemase [Bryobacteraceae bacterium]
MTHVDELDTPALIIDLDVMEQNLRRVTEYAKAHHLRLRPHTKTHKIPELGRRQLAAGAVGLTVAKVSEAEVMLRADPVNLLLAYPVVGTAKLARLVEVAKRTRVTVALDSETVARGLSATGAKVGVLAELNVGLDRVGVQSGEELIHLVCTIASLPGLDFEGITFYPGHIKQASSPKCRSYRRSLRQR